VNCRIGLAAVLLASCLASHAAENTVRAALPAGPQSRACHLPGHDEPLRCVDVTVPLDYGQPSGDRIRLHVTVAPAFRNPAQPDPLFVLAGGPGQAGSDILPLLDSTFRKVRATRDIVVVDQRGTGLSGKLDCDSTGTLEEAPIEEQESMVAACLRGLKRPFRFYTTDNAARDIDRIRSALGYRAVNLWGASYGTRLAQVYARRFPDAVRALVLDGVASPEQIVFVWGGDAQAALDTLFQHCEADNGCRAAYPALRRQFAALAEQVGGGKVRLDFRHPRTAARTELQLHPSGFLQAIRTALYSAQTRNRIPFLIDSASKGNWAPFLAQMYSIGDTAAAHPAIGLMLSVVCAEDIPRLTPAIVAEEERNSFLAGWEVRIIPRWCRFVDVPPVQAQAPTMIQAPALLLSGALDPVTPPHRAEAAARHIAHAQQFTVRNAGHIVSTLGCAPRLLREFLDRPESTLDASCLKDIPPTYFQLGPAGPQP
jgi:pimeloyl-ACP methyl ester carboxylesterase